MSSSKNRPKIDVWIKIPQHLFSYYNLAHSVGVKLSPYGSKFGRTVRKGSKQDIAFGDTTRGIPESDVLFRAFPHCTAKFTAIWGEFDAYAVGEVIVREQMLRNFYPDIDFRTVLGAGHWVMYEAPDEFNKIVVDMLG